jgi:hypothetical protein
MTKNQGKDTSNGDDRIEIGCIVLLEARTDFRDGG